MKKNEIKKFTKDQALKNLDQLKKDKAILIKNQKEYGDKLKQIFF